MTDRGKFYQGGYQGGFEGARDALYGFMDETKGIVIETLGKVDYWEIAERAKNYATRTGNVVFLRSVVETLIDEFREQMHDNGWLSKE